MYNKLWIIIIVSLNINESDDKREFFSSLRRLKTHKHLSKLSHGGLERFKIWMINFNLEYF